MTFKGQPAWVRTGVDSRPVLDSEGRAEMKYRENDTRTYRPSPHNLAAESAGSAPSAPAPRQGHAPKQGGVARAEDGQAARADTVHVWTDGACSGNPGPMGIGIVVVAGENRREHGEYLGKGTNNIAELSAIRRGLEIADELVPGRDRPIQVYSDSSYAIGLLAEGWKAKANQALVADLRELLRGYRRLRLVKVAGHSGVAENERCDLLARQAIACNREL
jgi:ribonuclease HI